HGDPCPSYNGLAVAYARVNHDTSQKSVHSHRPPRSSPFDRRLGVLSYKYIMQRTRVWPAADPRQLGQGFETPRGYEPLTGKHARPRPETDILARFHRAPNDGQSSVDVERKCERSRQWGGPLVNRSSGLTGLLPSAKDFLALRQNVVRS